MVKIQKSFSLVPIWPVLLQLIMDEDEENAATT